MSDETSIQYADTSVNPIMGCGGCCEHFPKPAEIFLKINQAVRATGHSINSRVIYEELISRVYSCIDQPLAGHKNTVNTSNVWHLRDRFFSRVLDETDDDIKALRAAEKIIKESITCYAALAHLQHGQSLLMEDTEGDCDYAPIFELVTEFPGRAEKAVNLPDLLGCSEGRPPWKGNLPRLISVSDMGDAFSGLGHFPFLKDELIRAITSGAGKRHLWLWLTKRPSLMAIFAEQIGGLPENVCAMTTLTSDDSENLKRLADLKKVQAHMRGLSIEPLWVRIDPKKLDLKGIDWVIVGGESGAGELTRPFALEWAEELRDHCCKKRVAFFLKQLGRNPARNGESLALKDSYGGNWDEWPDEALKVRKYPKAFHNYRKKDMKHPKKTDSKVTKKMEIELPPPTAEETAEFQRLDTIVKNGLKAFIETGLALIEIHEKKLWRAGGYSSWKHYCTAYAAKSPAHACRLMQTSECAIELDIDSEHQREPTHESQVRPLLRLDNLEDRNAAWNASCYWAEDKNCILTAKIVTMMVDTLEEDEYGKIKAKPAPEVNQRAEALSNLRTAILEKSPWAEVEVLLAELEKLI